MQKLFNKHILLHPLMLISYAILVFVLIGSIYLYSIAVAPAAPVLPDLVKKAATDDIRATGMVSPSENPNLAFLSGGTVATVTKAVGEHVTKGTVLAKLNTASLEAARTQAAANLSAAKANLELQYANTGNTTINLDQVKQQEDTLVENARRTMLSEGLEVVPASSNYTATAPTISGQYDGQPGTYKIVIHHVDQPDVDDHLIQTFDLEATGPMLISKSEATKLGTHGLYISFPDSLSDYDATTWYLTIPNTQSSSYSDNYNAYQSALKTRDKAIADATEKLNASADSTSVSGAQTKSAQAAVDAASASLEAANVALGNAIITAPFDGTLSAIRVKVGDNIVANTPVLSLSPDSALQVDVYLSELDVAKVALGDPVDVTLDAFGDNRVFPASVISIDRSPTLENNVPTYKTTIQFATEDTGVASGMTANVTIHPSNTPNI